MEFKIKRKRSRNFALYSKKDMDLCYKASKALYAKIGDFIKSIIVYNHPKTQQDRLHLLIITDDVSFELTQELVESYRIISEKTLAQIDSRFVITTMKLSSFWEHVRSGDPITINLIREGADLLDTGFFEPLQFLLEKGRIKPTEESVWSYFYKCPQTLQNSKDHLLGASLDLYWAASNISHAALMTQGIVPPSPKHLRDFIDKHLVQKGKLDAKYLSTMEALYKLSRMITHQQISEIQGSKYDQFQRATQEYVDVLTRVVEAGEPIG